MPVVTDYRALISGDSWNGIEVSGTPVIVTYSFPTTAPAYLAGIDGFTAATVSSFKAFTAEQTQARSALGEWAAASGITFVQVAPGQGDINFQLVDLGTSSYGGAGGIAFYPFGDWNYATFPSFSSDLDASGDVFMNSQYDTSGQVNYGTLLHEIGHAIGLKHPTQVVEDDAVDPPVKHDQVLSSDDPTRTVMATVGDSSTAGVSLKQLDKDAAAYLYGAAGQGRVVTANATGSNAVLSAWSWNAGTQVLTEKGFATADVIRGSSVTDYIYGYDADDRLFGLNGDDRLYGGAGNDFLNGGPGSDRMYGGTEDDTYVVESAGDRVYENLNEGRDTILSSISTTLSANVEVLQLFGDQLTGKGNGLDNSIFGDGTHANKLYGYDGADYMVAGSGADRLDGGTGADVMFGGKGNDIYYVDNAADEVHEAVGDGSDRVYASTSYTLAVGQEVESLLAAATAPGLTLTGNEFANVISGAGGNDVLSGGGGKDSLSGGGGNDRLVGGAAVDSLTGGGGADTFVLANTAADSDYVRDFVSGLDHLEISVATFGGGLAAGSLDPSQFVVNSTGRAGDANDRFIYDSANGRLYFDSNGTASGGSQQIAAMTGIPTLTASDFRLV